MSLEIRNLKKSFSNKIIFDSFSYLFPEKGLFVITGDSGIGKTTLLRLISGLDENFEGEILNGGPKNVSFAFQEHRLFPMLSALKNLTEVVFQKPTENDITSAKEMLFGLGFSENDLYLLPSQLSGGMKQRVSLARAFLKDAPILILDEPTKELDSDLCDIVRKTILSESNRRLVIMVTHSKNDISALSPEIIDLNILKNNT